MTQATAPGEATAPPAAPASALSKRYTAVAIGLHWAIAFLIIGLIAVGWAMEAMPRETLEARTQHQTILQLHKSIGITVFLLSVARIVWRLMNPPPPEPVMPGWQAFASRAVHILFYILILAMPLTGWIMASASPAFETRYFGLVDIRLPVLPGLPLETREAIDQGFKQVHANLAWVIVGLVVLHVGAALKHQFVDRDGLLARMAPGLFGRTAGPPDNGHGAIWAFGAAVLVFAGVTGASLAGAPPAGSPAPVAAEQTPASSAPSWAVDYAKSTLKFRFSYMGEAYEGQFPEWNSRIQLDTDAPPNPQTPSDGYVRVTIPVGKISTGQQYFDENVVQGDWFNANVHPEAVFEVSGGIYRLSETDYEATGVLKLKGADVPIRLPFTLKVDGTTATMHGEVTLRRLDLGIGAATAAEARGDEEWVGNDVVVVIDLVATRQ